MRSPFLLLMTMLSVIGLTSCLPFKPAVADVDLRSIPISRIDSSGVRPGRIANYYLTSRIEMSDVLALSKYDVLVLGLENAVNNPNELDLIRARNPKIKLLFYVQSNEFPWGGYRNNEPPNGPWHALLAQLDTTRHFLLDPTGKPAQFWPGTRSYNLTDQSVAPILAGWIKQQFAAYPWDGVFIDNVWSTDMTWYCSGNVDSDRDGVKDDMRVFSQRWITNLNWLGQLVRYGIGSSKLLIGNIGGDRTGDHSFWTSSANGRMFEGFPNTLPLTTLAEAYLSPKWQAPSLIILHAEANDDELQKVRFAWFFALLGNGAFAVDHGPNPGPNGDTGWHDEIRWYDELYRQPLGRPVTAAFRDGETKLWFREFDRALVVCNTQPTAITVNVTFRTTRTVTITVPALDGLAVPIPAAP